MDEQKRKEFLHNKIKGFSTKSVHIGEEDPREHSPVAFPIYQTATYYFKDTQALWDFYQKRSKQLTEYGRYGNPTVKILEKKLAYLEQAEDCLLFPNGMAAFATAILFFCKQGDHILFTNDGYRGIHKFVDKYFSHWGLSHDYVSFDLADIEKKIKPNTKIFFSEFPSNPRQRVLPLKDIAQMCRAKNIIFLLDATFATPYNCCPLSFGVDIVLHSATKYLGGHNDLLGGALLGSQKLLEELRLFQGLLGTILEPQTAYLLLRSLKTFAIRMEKINQTAKELALFLESHPKIERVWYPLLQSHPDFKIAQNYLKGGGGIVSFEVKGGLKEATTVVDNLHIPRIAASLGGSESLVHVVVAMSYYDLTEAQRKEKGISDSLIRLAVGLEDLADLQSDLEEALKKI